MNMADSTNTKKNTAPLLRIVPRQHVARDCGKPVRYGVFRAVPGKLPRRGYHGLYRLAPARVHAVERHPHARCNLVVRKPSRLAVGHLRQRRYVVVRRYVCIRLVYRKQW